MVAKVEEQGTLEGLCKVVSEHAQRGEVLDDEDPALDQVVQPEVSNVDMSRLLCCRAATLDQLDSTLIVLVYSDGGGIETLAG